MRKEKRKEQTLPQKSIEFEGRNLLVTEEAAHRALVNVACRRHEHDPLIVAVIDDYSSDWVRNGDQNPDIEWGVGRESRGYPVEGGYPDALRRAGELLVEECDSIENIRAFFGGDTFSDNLKARLPLGGMRYLLTATSEIAADMVLICEAHEHRRYVIGLKEDEARGWATGRPEGDQGVFADIRSFKMAVSLSAVLLRNECDAMSKNGGAPTRIPDPEVSEVRAVLDRSGEGRSPLQ